MMIDWVTAALPLSHFERIRNGAFLSINGNGEVEFEKSRFLQVEGSYSSKIQIVSIHDGPDGEIRFSGNPAKFLQGHNLFGSTDLIGMMQATMEKVYAILGIIPTAENREALATGRYSISRLDITGMFTLNNRADVLAWIRAAANASRSRHKSGGILRGDTLYWGMNSRRWAMKVYSKGQELEAHALPEDILHREKLEAWAENKLRAELVLRSEELKKLNLRCARGFAMVNAEQLFRSYLDKIIMPENYKLPPAELSHLPRSVVTSYLLWMDGHDVRDRVSKNTFYKHRRMLLEHGVDISVPQPKEASNVVPLVRVLEAIPAGIPDFAYGTALLWER